jgi:transposase
MRGQDAQPASRFSYVHLEDRIPADHPLRVIRTLIDPMLVALSPRFEAMYSPNGRRSIAPEKLLRALLLQVLYTIRSERQAPTMPGAMPLVSKPNLRTLPDSSLFL